MTTLKKGQNEVSVVATRAVIAAVLATTLATAVPMARRWRNQEPPRPALTNDKVLRRGSTQGVDESVLLGCRDDVDDPWR